MTAAAEKSYTARPAPPATSPYRRASAAPAQRTRFTYQRPHRKHQTGGRSAHRLRARGGVAPVAQKSSTALSAAVHHSEPSPRNSDQAPEWKQERAQTGSAGQVRS